MLIGHVSTPGLPRWMLLPELPTHQHAQHNNSRSRLRHYCHQSSGAGSWRDGSRQETKTQSSPISPGTRLKSRCQQKSSLTITTELPPSKYQGPDDSRATYKTSSSERNWILLSSSYLRIDFSTELLCRALPLRHHHGRAGQQRTSIVSLTVPCLREDPALTVQ